MLWKEQVNLWTFPSHIAMYIVILSYKDVAHTHSQQISLWGEPKEGEGMLPAQTVSYMHT